MLVQTIFKRLGIYSVTLQMIRVSDGPELASMMGTVNAVPSPEKVMDLERRLCRCEEQKEEKPRCNRGLTLGYV